MSLYRIVLVLSLGYKHAAGYSFINPQCRIDSSRKVASQEFYQQSGLTQLRQGRAKEESPVRTKAPCKDCRTGGKY